MYRNPMALVLLAVSCGGGVTLIDPPPPPPAGPTVLHLLPDTDDAVAAQSLGWETGIPGAEVTVTPADSSAPPRVVTGSATGKVDLSDLVAEVSCWVDIRRWLSPDERSRLPANEDVLGWVARTNVAPGAGEAMVRVPASREHGLVISEWAFNVAAPLDVNETYYFGGFLELFNNADTTVFLDGLIIGRALTEDFDYPNFPCAAFQSFIAAGLWVREVQQFPGSGRDYPVQPGAAVVVAIDAIDHSRITQTGLDLTRADFEFWRGAGDVDNPAVPNMIDTLALGGNVLGHGPVFQGLGEVAVLAKPYSRPSFQVQVTPYGSSYGLLRSDLILDVLSIWPNYVGQYPRCDRLVSAQFDRMSNDRRGRDENIEFVHSLSRRLIPTSQGSALKLQWTRNSDADFARTVRSPGFAANPNP